MYLMVLALRHEMHSAIDGLLFVFRDGHEVVKIPLKEGVEVLDDEDIRVNVDDIVHFPAF